MQIRSMIALFAWSALSVPLLAQSTSRASVDSSGGQANAASVGPSISSTGRFMGFSSIASNLVQGDTNGVPDVFVHDMLTGVTERLSVNSLGVEGNGTSGGVSAPSSDGRFIAFLSGATNLVPNDWNGVVDVFVRDRSTGTTELAPVGVNGVQANGPSYGYTSISDDGRYVMFASAASNLVLGDTNGTYDVFIRDRFLGTTERVDLSSSGAEAQGQSWALELSRDGRFATFMSDAANLVSGDTNGVGDVFVRDRLLGTTERISLGPAGQQVDHWAGGGSISDDGRFVVFLSATTNFAPWLGPRTRVYVRDRIGATTELVSVDSSGAEADGDFFFATMSGNGGMISFTSDSSSLLATSPWSNDTVHAYLRDRLASTTEIVDVSAAGVPGVADVGSPMLRWISSDGRFLTFSSISGNLVAGDSNWDDDIFVRDRGASSGAFCVGDGSTAACPCANGGRPAHGCENSASTGGALLSAGGAASLGADSFLLSCSGELPSAPSLFLQGSAAVAPAAFGDGLRCIGGSLKRLYVHPASGGTVIAPQSGELSISQRSSALGDPLASGAVRYYQVWYRDPIAGFCSAPTGDLWNISSGLRVVWN